LLNDTLELNSFLASSFDQGRHLTAATLFKRGFEAFIIATQRKLDTLHRAFCSVERIAGQCRICRPAQAASEEKHGKDETGCNHCQPLPVHDARLRRCSSLEESPS
jgi:hypothetical protein